MDIKLKAGTVKLMGFGNFRSPLSDADIKRLNELYKRGGEVAAAIDLHFDIMKPKAKAKKVSE